VIFAPGGKVGNKIQKKYNIFGKSTKKKSDFNNCFSGVASLQHVDKRVEHLVEPFSDGLPVLQLALLDPLLVLLDPFEPPVQPPVHDEPFHLQLFEDERGLYRTGCNQSR
jgi:hypothetical protein